MAHQTGILDLPAELLLLVFSDLDVKSFLNLTATCTALHAPNILYEPSYWSNLVRTTFRVPNQPVLAHDGARWHKLYKRMRTQSRVYGWGNNDKGCLGVHSPQSTHVRMWDDGRQMGLLNQQHVHSPQLIPGIDQKTVVADLQAGGWSTTLLTTEGALYLAGVIDGLRRQAPAREFRPLLYPPGFVQPNERYDSSTAVKQLSAGRCHVLALSDGGRIWSWHDASRAALHVKFLHHDLLENGKSEGNGVVKKVVAGWNKSAALIQGSGIVVWEPLQRDNDDTSLADAALVMQSEVVPHTSFLVGNNREAGGHAENNDDLAVDIGEVVNFIALEHVILFNTHSGRVFVSKMQWDRNRQHLETPVELPLLQEDGGEPAFVTDVQGSFRSFAVFTKSGAVLTGKQDSILQFLDDGLGDRSIFSRIPALQHNDVIQVAFGDYHFHALHASGYITSYGNEPQGCGAFGLKSMSTPGALRGITIGPGEAKLVPHAYTTGRRIWFQEEKNQWLEFLWMGGANREEGQARRTMCLNSRTGPGQIHHCAGEVSEWLEQEGREWEERLVGKGADEDGLGAHFVLSVTAAGWHSGALVLVNEDLEKRISQACQVLDPSTDVAPALEERAGWSPVSSVMDSAIAAVRNYGRGFLGLGPYRAPIPPNDERNQRHGEITAHSPPDSGTSPRPGMKYVWADQHFPRLVLSDGTEMPGTVPFDEWRYGRPEWDLSVSYNS